MSLKDVITAINAMWRDGVIERYAIGGAVGATFYLEPIATLDVDVLEEALAMAREVDVDGEIAFVFTAEHLAAIALQTGRAKDKARLGQFVESGALDPALFDEILKRHGLTEKWRRVEPLFERDPE